MGLSLRLMNKEQKLVFYLHIVQFILMQAAIIIGMIRLILPNIVNTRADTWILGVSAKSMTIMLYMVLTEHVARLQRFASVKANMILSIIETVFWFAAFIMPAMRFNKCVGVGCTLSAVVIALGAILAVLSMPITYMCSRQYIEHRRYKDVPPTRPPTRVSNTDNRWVSSDSEV